MEMKLAENIRHYRKQRGLTQEQLAEALGVTVGAVHKWEAKLSTPELALITEMADFFDVSVDALLGYRMKDNSLKATMDRMSACIGTEDPAGVAEAEKALKRFPHSFDIVFLSALTFMIFGGKNKDREMLNRASGLLEQSLLLLPQNTHQSVGSICIHEYLSTVQLMLGNADRAAEQLKEHNTEGVYDDLIGMTLSLMCKKPDEAEPYLSRALLDALGKLVQTVVGKAYAYALKGDHESAEKLLKWELSVLAGVRQPEATGYLDQTCAYLYALLSFVYLKKGHTGEARDALCLARDLAERFDAAPAYDARSFRFVTGVEEYHMHNILGRTAKDSVGYMIRVAGNEPLAALWKEICENE